MSGMTARHGIDRVGRMRERCNFRERHGLDRRAEAIGADIGLGPVLRIREKLGDGCRAHAALVFDALKVWLAMQLTTISGKSPLAAAIRYALTLMERLRPYLDNGILELDTDVVEQPLSQLFCSFGGLSFHASTMAA